MKPIIVRGTTGIVLFLPAGKPSHPGLIVRCLTDGTLLRQPDRTDANVRALLAAMLAKATTLAGAVQQVAQLDLLG
jgi:hypothetical protein